MDCLIRLFRKAVGLAISIEFVRCGQSYRYMASNHKKNRAIACGHRSCEKNVENVWERNIPLLASPQGGVAASSIERSEATETDAAGVVFLFVLNRKTTPASRSRTLRGILLIARPPLLAVMQGGESASPKHLDIFFTPP